MKSIKPLLTIALCAAAVAAFAAKGEFGHSSGTQGDGQ